jgi:glycolate oxidase FAD binding subunit
LSNVKGDVAVDVAALEQALPNAGLVAGANLASYAVKGAQPLVVARPDSIEGVSIVLTAASRLGAGVIPWGGGTRMGLGNAPNRYHVALDMQGLNSVVEHRPADLTVTVEAGCTVQTLQDTLRESGQYLPIDPAMQAQATIGGVLAVGTGGPLSAAFGLPRDLVIGMHAVLADGSMVKNGGIVVKNVTGYAMDRLYIGSMGTLAVITEATFKVTPLPRAEATVSASFGSVVDAVAACNAVAAQGLPLLAAEVLNHAACARAGLDGVTGKYQLLLRVAGRFSAVTRSVDACASACHDHGADAVTSMDDAASAALWKSVANIGWESGPPALALRLLGTPAQGAELMALVGTDSDAAVTLSATRGVVQASWASDATPDDVGGYLAGLRTSASIMEAQVVVESQSSLEGVDAWGLVPDGFAVMRQLKEQYDPQGILNPGRYVGGL